MDIRTLAMNTEAMTKFFDIVTSKATDWAKSGWGGYIKTNQRIELNNANPDLSLNKATDDMKPLVQFLTDNKIPAQVNQVNSWFDYFQKELEPPTAHPAGKAGAVASRLIPQSAFDTNRTDFAKDLLNLHSSCDVSQLWLMLVTPTTYPHTKTSALHPTWADAIWSVRIAKLWDPYFDSSADASQAYFAGVHEAMEPLRQRFPGMGVSLNEADIWEENAAEAFWGDNYTPLTVTKMEVDPWNRFSNWDAVGWDSGEERYACYPRPQST